MKKKATHWLKDLLSGAQFIWHHHLLRTAVSIVMIWFFCSLVRQAQLAIFLQHVLPYKKEALGLFMGFEGIGAVLTSLLLSRRKEITRYGVSFFVGFLLLSVGIFGLGMYQANWSSAVLYASAFVIGLGTGIQLVSYGYLLKKETPSTQIGRVSGTNSAFLNIALASGTLSSGFLVHQFGVREVYLALAIVMVILAFSSLVFLHKNKNKFSGEIL